MVEETGSRQGRKGNWEQTAAGNFLPEPASLSSVPKDMRYAFCLLGFVGLLLLLLFLFETGYRGWSGIHYIAQAYPELMEILLPYTLAC